VNGQSLRKQLSSPPAIATSIVLIILCGISLYLRIALPFDSIFVDGEVWFKGVDAWYHMRLVDNLLQHFPFRINFDPYTLFPSGDRIGWPPFFDWLIASSIKLFGGFHPSQHTADTIAVLVPPIMGTLTIFPVYFIGKTLFNRCVGLVAAALLIVLPNEFLNRTLLGFTDHHVAETLFSTTALLFLILAIKKSKEMHLKYKHVFNKHWKVLTWPLVYSLLAGLFLGIFLLSWVGGLMFIFLLFTWMFLQFIIDHLRGHSTDCVCIVSTILFAVAAILFLPLTRSTSLSAMQNLALLVAVATPPALGYLSYQFKLRNINRIYYPLLLIGLAVIIIIALRIIDPELLQSIIKRFGIFGSTETRMAIHEAEPLFLSIQGFQITSCWMNFTTSFLLGLIGIIWLIYLNIKNERADHTLFLVWSLIMLAAVLGQRRFSYYYTVNVVILTGYICWRVLAQAGLGKLKLIKENIVRAGRKAKKRGVSRTRRSFFHPREAWFDVFLVAVGIFFFVFFPSIGLPGIKPHTTIAGLPIKLTQPMANERNNINHAWYDSLIWLRENSPEPFGDPDFYYERYSAPARDANYDYPESAYSVMAWWDYGHWITRIARRIPLANPFQAGVPRVARFFTSQYEKKQNEHMDELQSKYVIVDSSMPGGKFYAIVLWANKDQKDFYDVYHFPQDNGDLEGRIFYYPSFYQSAVVHLYNFDGKAVQPDNSTVILKYEELKTLDGYDIRKVIDSQTFSSYKEATEYVEQQESGKYVLGNFDSFVPPISLNEMSQYKLVYESREKQNEIAQIKIFEYTSLEHEEN